MATRAVRELPGAPKPIATGFDFEPLADGNVLIEFYGDDGKTFNTQVITGNVLRSLPVVTNLTQVAMTEGVEAAKEIMESMTKVAMTVEVEAAKEIMESMTKADMTVEVEVAKKIMESMAEAENGGPKA